MFTRTQLIILATWILGPVAVGVAVWFWNIYYEGLLFSSVNGWYGINVLIWIQSVNTLILCLGFWRINQGYKAKIAQGRKARRGLPVALLAILTLIFLTIPALFMVTIYPSIVILMRDPRA